MSKAALAGLAPGTMKTVGSGISATSVSILPSRRSTMEAVTRETPACSFERCPGLVARSAPTTNSSRWSTRSSAAISPFPQSARARPSAATASSVVP